MPRRKALCSFVAMNTLLALQILASSIGVDDAWRQVFVDTPMPRNDFISPYYVDHSINYDEAIRILKKAACEHLARTIDSK